MPAGFLNGGMPVVLHATIPAAGDWRQEDYYEIEIPVYGVFVADCPLVDVDASTEMDARHAIEELAKIWKIETYTGGIRCYATAIPEADIHIRMLMIRGAGGGAFVGRVGGSGVTAGGATIITANSVDELPPAGSVSVETIALVTSEVV